MTSAEIHSEQTRVLPRSVRAACAVLAAVTAAACVACAILQPSSFWPGYLPAVVFWLGGSLGALSIALIHRLTGGRWGHGMSRELHAAVGCLTVGALALVPLIVGAPAIFPWAASEGSSHLNANQQTYLAPGAVLVRTAVSVLLWLGFAAWLLRGYVLLARGQYRRMSANVAAVGLIVYFLTVTSASVDGLMSLAPQWSSSLYGLLWVLAFAVEGLALVIVMRCAASARRGLIDDPAVADVTHDLGNFLLAFNMLWVYLGFSQYLIIWSADLPFETNWYLDRSRGWPGIVGALLLLFHFAVPLVLLLSRERKRDQRRLAHVAALLLSMRLFDLAWTVLPAFPNIGLLTWAMFVASVVAIGGVWLLAFEWWWTWLPETRPLPVASEHASRAEGWTGATR